MPDIRFWMSDDSFRMSEVCFPNPMAWTQQLFRFMYNIQVWVLDNTFRILEG